MPVALCANNSRRRDTIGGTRPPTKSLYDTPDNLSGPCNKGGACSGDGMNNQPDQSSRGGQWLTYRDLAERLGISVEAAQQKARRGRWQRRDSNDGRRLVLVPYETTDTPTTIAGTKPPTIAGTIASTI